MKFWSMFPKESPMIFMDKPDSNSSRKLLWGKEEILELKCGFPFKNFILEEQKSTALGEDKFANIVKALEILEVKRNLAQHVMEQAK